MKILYCFFMGLLRVVIFRIGLDAINTPIEINSICAGKIVCVFSILGFVEFIIKQIKK